MRCFEVLGNVIPRRLLRRVSLVGEQGYCSDFGHHDRMSLPIVLTRIQRGDVGGTMVR